MNSKPTSYDRKFARISRKLRDYPRARSSQLGEWDVFQDLSSGTSSNLFLGAFGDLAIMDLLGEFGLIRALAEQGITDPLLDLDLSDAYRHVLRLHDGEIVPEKLVAELVFRRTRLCHTIKPLPEQKQQACLHLEWLLLQNPHRRFDEERPRLPQQEYPGLNLSDMVLSLIAQMARVLHLRGIVTIPANLHSALFLLKCYMALSPRVQAELLALQRTVKKFGRVAVVWSEQWDDLLESGSGQPYHWEPSEMVQPLHEELRAWFNGQQRYDREVEHYQLQYIVRAGVRARSLPDGSVVREYQAASS